MKRHVLPGLAFKWNHSKSNASDKITALVIFVRVCDHILYDLLLLKGDAFAFAAPQESLLQDGCYHGKPVVAVGIVDSERPCNAVDDIPLCLDSCSKRNLFENWEASSA